MPISVKLADVVHPQRLAALTVREGGNPGASADRRLMIVHTGWVLATLEGGDDSITRATALSFVPNGDRKVQTYKPPTADLGGVQAVVAAALTSFGNDPDVAAVDEVSVALENRTFPGVAGEPLVLILRAKLAAQDGNVNRFGYQVTLLAHPDLLGPALTLSDETSPLPV
jgi:hypothetical protein